MPVSSLARIALTSRVYQEKVAAVAVQSSVWDTAQLDEAVRDLIESYNAPAKSVPWTQYQSNRNKTIQLLEDADATSEVIRCVRKLKGPYRMARGGVREDCASSYLLDSYTRQWPNGHHMSLVHRIKRMQHDDMRQLVKVSCMPMAPTQIVTFAESLQSAAASLFPPSLDDVYLSSLWEGLWTTPITSAFQSAEWTPELIAQLASVCPYDDPEQTVLGGMLRLLTPDLSTLQQLAQSESHSAFIITTLVDSYAARHHFELLGIEPPDFDDDDDELDADEMIDVYYDDIGDREKAVNIGRACAILTEQLSLGPLVGLELLRSQLVTFDQGWIDSIGMTFTYDHTDHRHDFFAASITFIGRWGATVDYGALSASERTALFEAVAQFEQPELQHAFSKVSLAWIQQIVAPLGMGGAMEAHGSAVHEICQRMLASYNDAGSAGAE